MKIKKIKHLAEEKKDPRAFAFYAENMLLFTYAKTFNVKSFVLVARTKNKNYVISRDGNDLFKVRAESASKIKIAGMLKEEGEFAFKRADGYNKIKPDFALLLIEFTEGNSKYAGVVFIYDIKSEVCCKSVLLTSNELHMKVILAEDIAEMLYECKMLNEKCINLMKENDEYVVIDVDWDEEVD